MSASRVGYRVDELGIIHQEPPVGSISTNKDYVGYYDGIEDKTRAMSCLRMGHLLAVIGHQNIRSVLDVGYGNGDFLKRCADAGFEAFGCDIQAHPVDHPRVQIVPVDRILWPYSVVTFFDSLEHFESLEFLPKMQADYIMVSVPWCHWSHEDPAFWTWKHRKPFEHLHHFNPQSLSALFEKAGYVTRSICNMEDVIRGARTASAEDSQAADLPAPNENILTAIFQRASRTGDL